MPVVKVTILGGAGGVGASTAFNLLIGEHSSPSARSGSAPPDPGAQHPLEAPASRPQDTVSHPAWSDALEVVLVDNRPEMITSHVMDFEQVLELAPGGAVRAGDATDVADADVVVLLSATPLTPGTPRVEYLVGNAAIADDLADRLDPSWPGVLLVATNPVDPLVTRLHRRTGIDRLRIIGYTINDSLRYRTGLAKALGVAPGTVEAWVIGEHGDLSVPLRDRVTVDGTPVRPTAEQTAAAEEYLRSWYPIHVALDSGRSSTWTSGVGVSRMVRALAREGELWPASVVLGGEYGLDGVAVTVPVTLARGGVRAVHEWELEPGELEALHTSATFVRKAVASIDAS